ncbi:peptidase S24 [Acinetobacter baumannii]|uniref:LexA family transcriptional regulator n=1 Tax=Acinetobacter baumannii TaxID=470 RepID=UPI0022B57DA2|nr:LexA family transcriptional regulator [Acinetobacter baumannii]ELA7039042.1 peptidase S24 [Acinetobacter baumannii]MCZ6923874.1 LexA family transcriptional regulator [Acinetobacter baumannii]MDN8336193.1 LexA family transcriptional regulator [Acinetobacter baumannii]
MSTLEDRINQAISHFLSKNKLKKLDRAAMAKYCEASVAAVGQWINGKTKSLDSFKNAKAAQFLGVNPHWLAGDPKYGMLDASSDQKFDNNIDLTQKINIEGRPVPVISWVAAGSFEPIETVLRDAEVDEYLPPIKECGRNGYGLIVTGISMLPKFEPEDRIYVNPDFQVSDLKTGDLVIVSCTGDNEATFKQLIIEGTTKYLKPLNPKWDEQIIKLTEDCRLVGKVVGLYRRI